MTLEEKIATFSGQGVPRLGVPSPGSSEAIHGLVRGGATDLEGFVRMSRLAETELRPEEKRTDLVHSTAFPQGYGLGETWAEILAGEERRSASEKTLSLSESWWLPK